MQEKIADIKSYIAALDAEEEELNRLHEAKEKSIRLYAHPRSVGSELDNERRRYWQDWLRLRGKTRGLRIALDILTGDVKDRAVNDAIRAGRR